MSKTRRGLLAAGLAVAAIGTIGVVSTLNASASDVPGDSTAVVSEDATTAPDDSGTDPDTTAPDPATLAARAENPPALLPTGATPRPVRKGRAGASSRALAAAGASAATDTTPARADTTVFGPKGLSDSVETSETSVAPPLPPMAAKKADQQQVNYLYANGRQDATTDGASAMFTVAKPTVGPDDWHSLAEVAIQSPDHQQTVEVGWTVDPSLFGDNETHLFVYHWVNGQETCYNCNFVSYSKASVKPGDVLAEGTYKLFGLQHYNGAWWVAYDTEWIGSFPDALFGGSFTQGANVQVFGEVASASSRSSCSQMGNAKVPSDTTAAKIGSVTFVNGPTVRLTLESTISQYGAQFVNDQTVRTFRYGGDKRC